jgi:hypothetical protein
VIEVTKRTDEKAPVAPANAAEPVEQDTAKPTNSERPLEGTGIGTSNAWDLAYGSNVPPKRDTTPLPPAEESHIGNMADPTPRHEYTVAGVTAKADRAKPEQNKEA